MALHKVCKNGEEITTHTMKTMVRAIGVENMLSDNQTRFAEVSRKWSRWRW